MVADSLTKPAVLYNEKMRHPMLSTSVDTTEHVVCTVLEKIDEFRHNIYNECASLRIDIRQEITEQLSHANETHTHVYHSILKRVDAVERTLIVIPELINTCIRNQQELLQRVDMIAEKLAEFDVEAVSPEECGSDRESAIEDIERLDDIPRDWISDTDQE